MIGKTNASAGGGNFSSTDALLRVQAPARSTVTITKGTTTKSDQGHENVDDNTKYDYYFIIHQSQFDSTTPWTVTATRDTHSASKTVTISINDEYDINLSFDPYAWEYRSSYDQEYWGEMNITHPDYTTTGDTIVGVSPNSGSQWAVVWPNAFSSSRKLSKIYLDASIDQVLTTSGGYELKFGVSNVNSGLSPSQSYCNVFKLVNTVAGRQTYELDVSSVTSGYLFVGGVGSMTVYNMWGTK